jgi:hypothetical protein
MSDDGSDWLSDAVAAWIEESKRRSAAFVEGLHKIEQAGLRGTAALAELKRELQRRAEDDGS